MKIPEGLVSEGLVILHHLADETVETIYPAVNTDETITLSTTSFSTFVFANLVHYDENGGEDIPKDPKAPEEPEEPTEPEEPIVPDTPVENDTEPVIDEEILDYIDELNRIRVTKKWNGKEGWQTVLGKDYYFNADGKLKLGWIEGGNGECLMNTTTPDGFKVDENGAKIDV